MMHLTCARTFAFATCALLLSACSPKTPTGTPNENDLSIIGQGVTANDLAAPAIVNDLSTGKSAPGGCQLATCASANASCGLIGDGCGGTIDCGTCASPQTCGGGGVLFQCGGAAACVPETCATIGAECGPAGDGCGNTIQCGTCSNGQTCGGGGQASKCGGSTDGGTVTCVPQSCADVGATCGSIADGCGNLLSCGTCAAGTTCGGGGINFQCGAPPCTPRTCASAGLDCGAAGDGCGNLIQCGTCAAPSVCGGGGVANSCGSQIPPDAGTFAQCNGGSTSISGTVLAGTDPSRGFGNPDPIYNAYVYVPSGPVQPIDTGATCDKCASAQPAIVSAVTGVDGTFTLTNVPSGQNVTVVIQLGKWQRVLTLDVKPCQNNVLTSDQTRLPRNRNEGNIPRFAFSTGTLDTLECVLRKMGIEDSEFVDPALDANGNPTAAGRVHIYQGRDNASTGSEGGAVVSQQTPSETKLWGSQTTLNAYDAVLFPCSGAPDPKTTTAQSRVIAYANAGGRVFATHYSYVWLYNDTPFSGTANWAVNAETDYDTVTGIIDQTFAKGVALAQWLQNIGASTTLGQIAANVVRKDFTSVVAPSQRWMYSQSPSFPLHYTFNTPVGTPAANQCGRVVFSDFHVENSAGSNDMLFPTECDDGPLTPQERLLEFMLFDLTSCVTPDVPSCTPRTCAEQGFGCGVQGDGCGNTINCGTCTSPQTCGGGGVPAQCGGGCTPTSCTTQNIHCGPSGDGCGNIIQCGTCPAGQTCGGGGQSGQCGAAPDMAITCAPTTCAAQNIGCGPAGDGCGNLIQCGTCPAGQTCGGGGVAGQCGGVVCMPTTCAAANANCGVIGNGCGGTVNCGACVSPQTCGGGGTANQCGGGIQ